MNNNVSCATGLSEVRQARARREVAALDYIRAIRGAAESGTTQVEIAKAVGITQMAVSKILASARERNLRKIPEGQHGASPYEIALRYTAGEITRDQMISHLSSWPYLTPGNDNYSRHDVGPNGHPPAMFQQVEQAHHDGLINDEDLTLIQQASSRPRFIRV